MFFVSRGLAGLFLLFLLPPAVAADNNRQDVQTIDAVTVVSAGLDDAYRQQKYPLGQRLYYFADQDSRLSIEKILQSNNDLRWQKSEQTTPTFGFTNSTYWFYVDLINPPSGPPSKIFQIANPLIDDIRLYVTSGNRILDSYHTGLEFPFAQRPINHRDFVFPINLAPGEGVRVYISVRTLSDGVRLPAYIWDMKEWQSAVQADYLMNGIYFGLLLGLMLYNFFLFLVIKDIAYLYYSAFQFTFCIFQWAASGYGYQFLWPEYVGLNTLIAYMFACLPGIFLCLFSYKILSVKGSSSRINKLWLALGGLFAAGLILTPFIASKLYIGMISLNPVVLLMAVLFAVTSIRYWRLGLVARIWSIALLIFISGAALYVLPAAGLVESNIFLEHTVQLGSAVEAILLSLLLGYRIRSEQNEKFELLNQSEGVRQAAMAKSRFLAAASHDLRQPLHALSLFVDILKDEKSASGRKRIFSQLDASLEAMRKLFDAMLDISRLDANAVLPEVTHFYLEDLVGSLVDEFSQAANDKKLLLKKRISCGVVVSDRMLLERILRNLIANAIRYTEKGGVLVTCRSRGDAVQIQIWDTGIGIAKEDWDEVFIEFRQLDNTQRDRNQGLGLGLAIVKRLCGLLKHPLELRSQPGRGSVFTLRIPTGDQGLVVVKEASIAPHSWDLSGRRIAVIDDERDIRDAMRALLSKWGCEVIVAGSLTEAVQALREKAMTPELIVSDLRLRDGCTGVEAIEGLQAQFGASIPGILVTGETGSEQLMLAKDSGYKLLQKPVQPIRLRSVIQQHLSATK
jgi:signal transduction histidine kinase